MLIQPCSKAWKASKASSDSDTHSDFLLAPSPARCSFNSWAIHVKPLYELPVMAYKAKEGANLCIGLRQCTLSDGP